MPEEFSQYASVFPQGGRVRVGIPVTGGGTFQEWGVVSSLERDLLGLELSRDTLPSDAVLELGNTLELRPAETEERCCRAVLVRDEGEGLLALRLIDGLVPFEQREYFRQDVYLAVDYRIAPRQQVIEVRERWHRRRRDLEIAAQMPDPNEPPELTERREAIRCRLETRAAAHPVAANMSGGGILLRIPERLEAGTLVELTLYLPQPRRVLELVGEVVDVRSFPGADGFSTALRYRFIEEVDRDRIVGYVSAEQLTQLARLGRGKPSDEPEGEADPHRQLRVAAGLLVLALLTGYLSHSIVAKRERGEKHEIERVFEEGIAQYLKQRR